MFQSPPSSMLIHYTSLESYYSSYSYLSLDENLLYLSVNEYWNISYLFISSLIIHHLPVPSNLFHHRSTCGTARAGRFRRRPVIVRDRPGALVIVQTLQLAPVKILIFRVKKVIFLVKLVTFPVKLVSFQSYVSLLQRLAFLESYPLVMCYISMETHQMFTSNNHHVQNILNG